MTIVKMAGTQAQTPPFDLQVHLNTTLHVTAREARQLVNRQVVTELGTGLVADEPELVILDEQFLWRVPIVMSLPTLGNLGQVGSVCVDAQTGTLIEDKTNWEGVLQHAQQLYAGATLSTK